MVAVNGSCCVYLYSEGFWKPRPVTRQMTENTGECFIARHRTCSPDYNAQTFRDDNSNDREGVGISIIHSAGFGEVLIYTGGEKKKPCSISQNAVRASIVTIETCTVSTVV